LNFVEHILFEEKVNSYKKNQRGENSATKEGESDQKEEYSGLTLEKCFDLFSREEQLSENDMWYCSKCQEHKRAFKKMELWTVPPILVLHLKRFSQEEHSHFVDKNDEEVRFPLDGLDLTKRVKCGEDEVIYDLLAVSNHFGGLGGGHYTAFARDIVSRTAHDSWYEFDDSSVRKTGPAAVVSHSAYVLFYFRRPTKGETGNNTEATESEE